MAQWTVHALSGDLLLTCQEAASATLPVSASQVMHTGAFLMKNLQAFVGLSVCQPCQNTGYEF